MLDSSKLSAKHGTSRSIPSKTIGTGADFCKGSTRGLAVWARLHVRLTGRKIRCQQCKCCRQCKRHVCHSGEAEWKTRPRMPQTSQRHGGTLQHWITVEAQPEPLRSCKHFTKEQGTQPYRSSQHDCAHQNLLTCESSLRGTYTPPTLRASLLYPPTAC